MLTLLLLPPSRHCVHTAPHTNNNNNHHPFAWRCACAPQLSTFYYHQLIDNEKLRQSNLGASGAAAVGEPTLAKLFRQPQVYKPLIILLFVFLFQQCSGCYILIFYTINIFRNLSSNFSQRINENMALMLLGALRLVVSVIASG
jgi:facilitated trehalose transporter